MVKSGPWTSVSDFCSLRPMNNPISLQQAFANRRFAFLMLAFIGALGVYVLMWMQGAQRLRDAWDQAVFAASARHITLAARTSEIQGFPFRLELHVHDLDITTPWGAFQTDLVVIRGLPLRRDHLLIDGGLGPGVVLNAPSGKWRAGDARASLVGDEGRRRLSVDVKKLEWLADGQDQRSLFVTRAQYHARPGTVDGQSDHDLQLDGIGYGTGPEITRIAIGLSGSPDKGFAISHGKAAISDHAVSIEGTLQSDPTKFTDSQITLSGDTSFGQRFDLTSGDKENMSLPLNHVPDWAKGLIGLALNP